MIIFAVMVKGVGVRDATVVAGKATPATMLNSIATLLTNSNSYSSSGSSTIYPAYSKLGHEQFWLKENTGSK